MKLGVYTACLHDKTLDEALATIAELGLTSIEVNSGGFIDAPHIHVDSLLQNATARREYLARIADAGLELTALNVNGNPLHPDVAVSSKHSRDLHRTIELAGLLGVRDVITMSGQPGADRGSALPAWVVEPWNSASTEMLAYQWDEVTVPYWTDIEQRAANAGVRVALELHPHNVVFNPATLVRLIERTGGTHIGAEMDPSHLFWQGMEPIAGIEYLGDRVFVAAAKDVRINEENCRLNGMLDDRFVTPGPGEFALNIGGRFVANNFPAEAPWNFVTVGRGHDTTYWADFLAALQKVDPDIAINLEHEDVEMGQFEGLQMGAETMLSAEKIATGDTATVGAANAG
ncbi:sugar phosphate isomerase/epimerase family protein [Williamsia maris]|uniref:Sugar phosphate isomerase/epimerase n=1 Tax=Williamsia maris TaxID=72806 RepID=A0ABT1HIE9_9NOCA|nr:sugar phosphate isomerase/epimerase [Williamsia maris]MCP2177511.1 Sugar phosphate isomerase/epimerase [Williamsia maris]